MSAGESMSTAREATPEIAELVQRLHEQCHWKTDMPCANDPPNQRCVSCRAADALETLARGVSSPPDVMVHGGDRGRDPYAIEASLPQDAEFIASAPGDIAALLAEVATLRETLVQIADVQRRVNGGKSESRGAFAERIQGLAREAVRGGVSRLTEEPQK